jgi:CheY-like chemotaxis protein
MFYHMLTGRPPLVETKDRTQRLSKTRFESIPPITDLDPDLPHRIVMIVKKAMELNVKRRYQSPAEFLADLQLCAKRINVSDAELALLEEGANRSIMIVDSNPEMQDVFRKGLKKVGYRVLVMSDATRAIDRCDTDEKVADCVVFGCHSLGRSGLEAFNKFAQIDNTKTIPTVLLLAEKQASLASDAELGEKRVVATLPLKMKEFRGLLRSLLAAEQTSP